MSLKTVVFVDGQNFRHDLRNFGFRSNRPHPGNVEYHLDEKHFNWQEFFQDALGKFDDVTGWDHQLVRVYWYYAENITPFSPDPPKGGTLALTQGLMGKGRRTIQA